MTVSKEKLAELEKKYEKKPNTPVTGKTTLNNVTLKVNSFEANAKTGAKKDG